MAAKIEPADRQGPRLRTGTRIVSEPCCVCDKELSDEDALIVTDCDPVDFMDGPGVLKGYEIRCEHCIALLPERPVCTRLMNECPTCGAHYCRRHALQLASSAGATTVAALASLCDFCNAIRVEIGVFPADD
ncbi:hypothetical protein [Candidatus Poriferisodalis sp.]|uniref:hypothetical protein n=1 Tax=Candidatus Poriferisodalis sp. TaxID=3101277 RepID=UPI003C6F0624